jgi:uncharacterized membrane protein YfhO
MDVIPNYKRSSDSSENAEEICVDFNVFNEKDLNTQCKIRDNLIIIEERSRMYAQSQTEKARLYDRYAALLKDLEYHNAQEMHQQSEQLDTSADSYNTLARTLQDQIARCNQIIAEKMQRAEQRRIDRRRSHDDSDGDGDSTYYSAKRRPVSF